MNKVALIAVNLEEDALNKYKITSMKSNYITERDQKDNTDKRHILLSIVVEKQWKLNDW